VEKVVAPRKLSQNKKPIFSDNFLLIGGLAALLISSILTLGLVLTLYIRGATSIWDILQEEQQFAISNSTVAPSGASTQSTFIPISSTLTPAPSDTPTSSPSPSPTRTPTLTRTTTPTRTITPTPSMSPTPLFPSATPIIPTLAPVNLPPAAYLNPIPGSKQVLPLSCEAHVAVVWANFFGATIDEMQFLNRLPRSDNPEKGYVGNPAGSWGRTPPHDYGVHAQPVADLLRQYGVRATAHKQMSIETIKAEIASGRPVIVWVVGHVGFANSILYTAQDGEEVLVAPYEHTVIVVGYDQFGVRILDGEETYDRPLGTFLRSWETLENMAIIRGD